MMLKTTTMSTILSRWWLVGCMEGLLGVDSFNTVNQLVDTLPSKDACASYTTTAGP